MKIARRRRRIRSTSARLKINEYKHFIKLYSDWLLTQEHQINAGANVGELVRFGEEGTGYRIEILQSTGRVDVQSLDIVYNFLPDLKNLYKSVDDLPKWVQDKLAVLMICDLSKPTPIIANVGRRISENIFWVFTDGADT
jgi:hypothetical protein